MRRERGALQVGQDPADRVAPTGLDGLPKRAVRADEDRARDEELGNVHVERRLRGAERRGREVDEHRAVVDDEDVARVESSVRDAGRVQPGDLRRQSSSSSLVAHLIGRDRLERVDVRLACDDQCVAVGAEGRDHDFGNSNAGLCRHQGGERLVLDLLQSTGGGASRGILVREQPPLPRESLRVLRIAAEHARPAAGVRPCRARRIRRRRRVVRAVGLQVAHARPRARAARCEPARSAARPPPSRRSAARAPLRPDRVRRPASAPDGSAAPSTTAPRAASGTSAGGDHANRADELRPDDDDDRGRTGEPDLRVAPAGEQMRPRPGTSRTRRPDPGGRPCPTTADRRDEQIACEIPTSAHQNVDDDRGREPEQAEERGSPQRAGPAEHRRQRLSDVAVVSGRRRGDRCGQPDDDRGPDQEDRVDRSPVPAPRLGFGQQRDVPGSIGRRRRLVAGACRGRQDSTAMLTSKATE